MDKTINILCATDDNYAPYCGVMLTSVFESNKRSRFDVYILVNKPFSDSSKRRFHKLAERYKNVIHYLIVDDSYLAQFPIKGLSWVSIATYYRLYVTSLLPESIHRILYLDCDIIVNGPLDDLWWLDMQGKAVGCIPDVIEYSGYCQRLLQYPNKAGYFNAGVILIELDYWRANAIGQECLDYLASHYDLIEYNDQDVLNAVLWDRKYVLPLRYNFQVLFLKQSIYSQYDSTFRRIIESEKKSPVIIHYAAQLKPWQMLYFKMPYRQLWKKYKWKSPWWYLLPQLPKKKAVNYLIKRYVLWPLGIMYPKQYLYFSPYETIDGEINIK